MRMQHAGSLDGILIFRLFAQRCEMKTYCPIADSVLTRSSSAKDCYKRRHYIPNWMNDYVDLIWTL
jgi:hypothetical protein